MGEGGVLEFVREDAPFLEKAYMLFGKRMHPFREKHVCSFKTRKTYENRNEHIPRRTALPHPCLRLAGTRHALLSQLRAPLGQRAAEAVDHAQPRAPLPPPRGRVLPRAADTYAQAGEGGGGRTGCAVEKIFRFYALQHRSKIPHLPKNVYLCTQK